MKKEIFITETIIIIILSIIVVFLVSTGSSNKLSYCSKHYYDNKVCLISPSIYTNTLAAESFLILNLKPLQTDMQNYINENNFNMSVYILNLRDGASFGINSNIPYEPASLNKLPVAIIILKKVEEGKLTLDTMLPITNDERDSLSGTLYKTEVTEMSVRELLHYMLSESDNTALWVLGKQVTLEDMQKLSSYLNYYQKDINYTLKPDTNLYEITAKSTGNLFVSLYLSTALKPEDSELILSYLSNTSFDIKKYANLPNDVVIAQKYGAYYIVDKKSFHSCGIIYVQDSRFFYCIMTRDLDMEKASQVVGKNLNMLYNFIIQAKKVNDITTD